MKKQNRITLVKLALMIALGLSATAISANAQSYEQVRAKIPFEFTVGDQSLPADTYTFQRISANVPFLLSLRGNDRLAIANGFTSEIQASKASAQTKLIFHKYGDQYFLSEMWIAGNDTGRRFPKSRTERELNRDMARNASQPETVIVAIGQP
ncbi:MAG: hypothetical protein JST85_12970 [Acidobacteria bacterium]|nr:hypothetical protein [Acidobacteriota bacterium]